MILARQMLVTYPKNLGDIDRQKTAEVHRRVLRVRAGVMSTAGSAKACRRCRELISSLG